MTYLNENLIFADLSKELQSRSEIIILPEVDSTHSFLDQLAIKDWSKIVICTTENQLAGKGRLDRVWQSSSGQDICLSLALFLLVKREQLAGLSLVIGIALCRALKVFDISEKILVKWPNDLMYNDQKLAGILVQHQEVAPNLQKVIVSVGINVNSKRDGVVSLKQILGRDSNRNELIAKFTNHIYRAVFDFASGGLGIFQKEWQGLDYLYGKKISIAQGDTIHTGTAIGLDLQGKLVIENDKGEQQAFSSPDSLLVKRQIVPPHF